MKATILYKANNRKNKKTSVFSSSHLLKFFMFPFFKGCIYPKTITQIINGNDSCIIIEGFFDYLSFLMLYPDRVRNHDFIILNSTSLIKSTIPILNTYNKIFLFLDNDKTGEKTTSFIETNCSCNSINCSFLYRGYSDINEYLMKHITNDLNCSSY
ncbi:MAG: toprim domain-containing protein [Salinivirgaceae bacterium]